jgi:hypothetical protein
MKITEKDIMLIPAVSRVLVEYERTYNKKDAREMFDIMINAIVRKVNYLSNLKERV